jgi:RNA polymerase sigma-54 factor
MKLSLDIRTSLSQTLTPQQIQYLKMLQLPVMQLEQYLQQELEQNPMLEDSNNPDIDAFEYDDDTTLNVESDVASFDTYSDDSDDFDGYEKSPGFVLDDDPILKSGYDDDPDPFDLYSMVWQDSSETASAGSDDFGSDDEPHFQIKSHTSLEEDLIEQLNLLDLSEEENLLGRYIIGNIDDDGYLRRQMHEIIDDTNSFIAEMNFNIQHKEYVRKTEEKEKTSKNPAAQFSISNESLKSLEKAKNLNNGIGLDNNQNSSGFSNNSNSNLKILSHVTLEQAEKVLSIVQSLDPPGIASRDMRECLISQCKAFIEPNPAQELALRILEDAYEPFIKKHYAVIIKQLSITEEDIKQAIDVIKRLNPKPGGGDSYAELNTVIPDFIVERDEDTDELTISLNDLRLPNLKLSKAYESLQKDAKNKKYNKETKNWIRGKREDAKFMIQAIKQRKNTMLKVMTAIATLQKNFFYEGKSGLKPLIYKDIAEQTALDISTVCRIVNGKYVQTEFGTYELKFYFSEALITDDGEDVSTTIIKEKIKNMIDSEPKNKPYSDDLISKLLKENGFNVARRTVAKYREQMRIPVARLRVEI